MTMPSPFVTLFDLGLLPDGYLSKSMLQELRLTSRSMRDWLNREFWHSIIVYKRLASFLDILIEDPEISSHIKRLKITEYNTPDVSDLIKFVDILPRLVNIEHLVINDFNHARDTSWQLTKEIANTIAPRDEENPWQLFQRPWMQTIDGLSLESDCFWDIVWERHHGKGSSLKLESLFPKLQNISVCAPHAPITEKQLARIPNAVQSIKLFANRAPSANFIQILQHMSSLRKVDIYPHPAEPVHMNETKTTFPNINEFRLWCARENELLLMSYLPLFPNLRILYPWFFTQDNVSRISSIVQQHCPQVDTFRCDTHFQILQFPRLRGLRHVIVDENEDSVSQTNWYIKVFKHMPEEWKRTIETVEFSGMRIISREKCENLHRQMFSADEGYVNFSTFVAKYANTNSGAVLKVKDGVIVDFYRFGYQPKGVKFAREVHDVYPDNIFKKTFRLSYFLGQDE